MIVRIALLDRYILPFGKSGLVQALAERRHEMRERRGRRAPEEPDRGYRRLLRVHEVRGRDKTTCKAADECSTIRDQITSETKGIGDILLAWQRMRLVVHPG